MTRDEAVARAFEVEKTMLVDMRNPERPDVSQLEFLYELALAAPDGLAVEVGVYFGGSLAVWAAAREGRGGIVAVDDWSMGGDIRRGKFLANMQKFGIKVYLSDLMGWRAPITMDLRHFGVAFCFIDSDHTWAGIGKELPLWTDAMMPGGIIAFHDYGVWKPNVAVEAVVDVWHRFTQWEHLGLIGSTIAFRRPEEET
jgi:predicted O-methyltransferase YrrM